MAINVYLSFNGNCREAVEFYAKVFRSEKPQIMSFGDTPPNPEFPLPEEAKNLVMHSQLKISGCNIMCSDVFPGTPFVAGNNISLAFISKDLDEMKSIFTDLKESGIVEVDLQETFWSKCYGSLTDRFGIKWQFNCDSD